MRLFKILLGSMLLPSLCFAAETTDESSLRKILDGYASQGIEVILSLIHI